MTMTFDQAFAQSLQRPSEKRGNQMTMTYDEAKRIIDSENASGIDRMRAAVFMEGRQSVLESEEIKDLSAFTRLLVDWVSLLGDFVTELPEHLQPWPLVNKTRQSLEAFNALREKETGK